MPNAESATIDQSAESGCFGWCKRCGVAHGLGSGRAREHATELMRELRRVGRLDLKAEAEEIDPALALDRLFDSGRGHMFGLLECLNEKGETVILRAFSSLAGGHRSVPGWVPPILSDEVWRRLILPIDAAIKKMSKDLLALAQDSAEATALKLERRRLSRRFNLELQASYRLHNFRGEISGLRQAFTGSGGLPGGTGECCAPKLLHHASRQGLRPVGIAEFCFGGPLGDMRDGEFYRSCESRCQPILGFLLCGLES